MSDAPVKLDSYSTRVGLTLPLTEYLHLVEAVQSGVRKQRRANGLEFIEFNNGYRVDRKL